MGNRLHHPFRLKRSDGVPIDGIVKALDGDSLKPVLILNHGFRGSKDRSFWPYVTDWFADRGFYTVSFNFSRIPILQGEYDDSIRRTANTVSRELSDLETLLDHLKAGQLGLAEHADFQRIAILGHSRAGGSSIVFASEHPEIGWVGSWNGPAQFSFPTGPQPDPAIAEDYNANLERFDIPQLLAELNIPALIVQGDQDAERLVEGHRKLRELIPGPSFVSVEGADHGFGTAHPFAGTTVHLEEALETTLSSLKLWLSGDET